MTNPYENWDRMCEAYRDTLVQLIPVRTHRAHLVRRRRKALKFAKTRRIHNAKYLALKLGADRDQLVAAEMLIFGHVIHEAKPGFEGEVAARFPLGAP
jgi:hypothetical protein